MWQIYTTGYWHNFNTFDTDLNHTYRMRQMLFWLAALLFFTSCTVNKDILFKTPNDYAYDSLPNSLETDARITPNNIVAMNFFTGDGHVLIENSIGGGILTGGNQQNNNNLDRNQVTYLVDKDGTVKLPVLGRVSIAGLSIREAERNLEDLYSGYYNEPFVLLTVTNNRVIVSPGSGGEARVITLINANTTLLEAIALAGGVSDRGMASKVKLIRYDREVKKRDVYKIDLSTVEGLAFADIIVQPNDIIYIEPMPLIASELVREITPFITILTTTILIIALINR